MRFQVPQFIEVEDKIFGPLTFKQFIYLVGGAGLAFLLYHFIGSLYFSLIFIIPVLGLAAALAFYKVNNKPFIEILEAAVKYTFAGKLYIWKKQENMPVAREQKQDNTNLANLYVPKLSDSKLKDLTWSLDIKQAENPVTNGRGQRNV